MLKGQDLVVALKLAVSHEPTTYAGLALSLSLNASEVHTAVKRALHAQLLVNTGDFIVPKNSKLGNIDVHKQNLLEFVTHGAKYVFAADRISVTVGVPTSHSAPIFQGVFAPGSDDWVWPYALGSCKGVGIKPIHPCVPSAALADSQLYAALALLDALRVGRARERNMALPMLEALILRNVNMTRAKELVHG